MCRHETRLAASMPPALRTPRARVTIPSLIVAPALVVALAIPASSRAQTPAADVASPTVAVMDFEGSSLSLRDAAAVGKGLAGMMITELHGRPGLRVIERQQLRDLLREQELALSGRVDEASLVEIGRLVNAQFLVAGGIFLYNDDRDVRLDVRIIDVETSEIQRSEKLSGRSTEFPALLARVVDAFTRDLDIRTPERRRAVEVPWDATLAYSRALDFEDQGDVARAIDLYREAVRLFPEHPEAKAALERLVPPDGGAR